MAQLSKSALTSENNNSFPNNNTGYITPELLRTFNQDVIDSTVNQTVYTADSASWNSQIAALDPSGSAQSIVELNEFTASQNTKNTTLASVTASLQQQLTNIGSQSGSWVTESETSSFARTNVTNTFTQPQIISAAVTASAARIANLNYPTTDNGAKSFVQTDGNGNLSLQYVETVYFNVRNMSGVTLAKGTPVYISGSTGDNGNAFKADATNQSTMPATCILAEDLTDGEVGLSIISGEIEGINTTGYPAGTEIYVAEGGGWSLSRPSGSNSIVQKLGVVTKEGVGGQGHVINQLEAELPNLQTGYAWVGNGSNQPVQVATSSFGGGGSTDITSLNAFTASQDIKNTTLAGVTASLQSYTASQNTINQNVSLSASIYETKFATIGTQSGSWGGGSDLTSLNAFTASQETKNSTLASVTASLQQQLTNIGSQSGSWITESETGSFLVTASVTLNTITFTKGDTTTFNIAVDTGSATDITSLNAFTASQEVKDATLGNLTGSFAITGSNSFLGNQQITGSLIISSSAVNDLIVSGTMALIGGSLRVTSSTSVTSILPTAVSISSGSNNVVVNRTLGLYNTSGSSQIGLTAGSTVLGLGPSIFASSGSSLTNYSVIQFQDGGNYTDGRVTFPTPVVLNSALTASLTEGYVWAGGAGNVTTLVATSSFGGGGAAFPYTGNAVITGSLGISGSMFGGVVQLSVATATASVDFSAANMFTLTLPSASTHINPTNIRAGQTVNIQITQPTPGTGSVTFPSNVKFAGGNDYQATQTGSAIDMLTLVSYDGTNVLATSIKNFL